MTRASFSFLILFGAVLGEILAESGGLKLTLAAPIIFYLTYAFGYQYGIICAVLTGCILDFSLGYTNPWSILFLLCTVGFALFWLYQTESDSLVPLIIPGLILPFLSQFPSALIQSGFRWTTMADAAADAVICGIGSAILFPFLILLLDWLASKLSLDLFADAKERLRDRTNAGKHFLEKF